MSKPLNYAVSTKSRKTMRHQLSKPNTFQPLFTQQPTMVYNLIGPARSWHYPLQCYTILGLFNAFSTLLKLIFHQVTYITTIFQWHVGYPWSPHGLTSLPCFELDGYNFSKLQMQFTQLYMDLLQHKEPGKHAQFFLRHQITVGLTFTICHAIFAI